MRPNRSTAACVAAFAPARLVTSNLTISRSSDSPIALATVSVLRPVATTLFPAARAALAIFTPIPRPAPVINQTLLMLVSLLEDLQKTPGCFQKQEGGSLSVRSL